MPNLIDNVDIGKRRRFKETFRRPKSGQKILSDVEIAAIEFFTKKELDE